MSKTLLLLRLGMALCLVLPTSCMTSRGSEVNEAHPKREPMTVRVSELPGGKLRLAFKPVAPDLTLEQVRPQEAREVLATFHASFP